MHRGYIKLYRRIKDHWLWKERNKKFSKGEAWTDLLLRANHKEGNELNIGNEIINQKRGEVFTSQLQLAYDWKWSRKKVKSFLELLKRDSMITLEVTNQFTRVFLSNYEKYNPPWSASEQQIEQQDEQQSNNEKTSKTHQRNTINNDKNSNNVKNNQSYEKSISNKNRFLK